MITAYEIDEYLICVNRLTRLYTLKMKEMSKLAKAI